VLHLADGLRYHLGRQNAYRVLCTCNLLLAYVFFTLAGGQVMEVEVYPGVSRWKLIPNLWMHKTVNVTCPGTAVRLSSSQAHAPSLPCCDKPQVCTEAAPKLEYCWLASTGML